MKNDRRRRNRPRNREKKGVKQSPGQECRHVWSDGVCLKCGCLQHAQTAKNCPQDKILRAVQMSEIIDGNSMAEAFYKISLA